MKGILPCNRGRRGNALLEFGLAAAVILPIFAGSFQFGYSYYLYGVLETSVRSAARYAATRKYDSATATPSSAFQTAVHNMAVYGNPTGGTTPVVPGLSTSNVAVTVRFDTGVPREVTVAITDFRLSAIFGAMTLNNKPKVSFPYCGNFSPVI